METKLKTIYRVLGWITGAVVCFALLIGLWIASGGYADPPPRYWYPFINSLFSDYYTTGPFAMTSNTREENPVWESLPAFNLQQARLAYAMTRGESRAAVAWLFPAQEWPDTPAIGGGLQPNAGESEISRALSYSSFGYDRVSRRNLLAATVSDGQLTVGVQRYQVLLVSDLHASDPELLQRIIRVARAGVPVLWLGSLPSRSTGWAEHEARDRAVAELNTELEGLVRSIDSGAAILEGLQALGITAPLSGVDGPTLDLRVLHRILQGADLFLLFNEGDQPVRQRVSFNGDVSGVAVLDPASADWRTIANASSIELEVPARRIRLLLVDRSGQGSGDLNQAGWDTPARHFHPYIRWWWPGNAVDAVQLEAELKSMQKAGFGGVEIQTLTIGLTHQHLEDNEQRIYQVGSPGWLENVRHVMAKAGELDLAVDLTLGSGWSSGGPFIRDYPEQQLLLATSDLSGPHDGEVSLPQPGAPFYSRPSNWIIANTIGRFDTDLQLRAAVIARIDKSTKPPTLSALRTLAPDPRGDRVDLQLDAGAYRLFALYQNDTAHNVAASAYENGRVSSPVVDHLDRRGAQEYIAQLGDPWLRGLYPLKPRAFFIDSFELIGELPWSSVFAAAFRAQHGYDLRPYLPLMFREHGESKYLNVILPPGAAYRGEQDKAERVREDYELTRQALFISEFVQPLRQWIHSQGIDLRLQAHGGFGDYLDVYQLADIPEAEGLFAGGSFEFLKLAASAGHIAGRSTISSESFITMDRNYNGLTLEDYYLLMGNAFAAGITRTICHGYAYHYEPGSRKMPNGGTLN